MAEQSKIEMIKALRERTGAGMMDCVHALDANGNDIEKSVDWLREKGIAKQASRANRTAAEGLTRVKICPKCGHAAVIEVNCETDFVSGSDKFIALADQIVSTVLEKQPKTLDEARKDNEQILTDTALAVREKIDFRRFALAEKKEGQGFGSYCHMGGKVSVLVLLAKDDPELANQLAVHICSANPVYIDLNNVPQADRDRELAVAQAEVKTDEKLAGKPDAVKAQIAVKKAEKALGQNCLTGEKFLFDESKTVEQVLKEKDNKVISFIRYQVGEGVAKDPNQAN
jgi:elongation factor Ts